MILKHNRELERPKLLKFNALKVGDLNQDLLKVRMQRYKMWLLLHPLANDERSIIK